MSNQSEDIIAHNVESLLAKTAFATRGKHAKPIADATEPVPSEIAHHPEQPTTIPSSAIQSIEDRITHIENRLDDIRLKSTALIAAQKKQIDQLQSAGQQRSQRLHEFEDSFDQKYQSFVNATTNLAERIAQVSEQIPSFLDNQGQMSDRISGIQAGFALLQESSQEIRSALERQATETSEQLRTLKTEIASVTSQYQEPLRRLQEQLDDLSSLMTKQDAQTQTRLATFDTEQNAHRNELDNIIAQLSRGAEERNAQIKTLQDAFAALEAGLSRTNNQVNSNEKAITELVKHAEEEDKRSASLAQDTQAELSRITAQVNSNEKTITELVKHAEEEDKRLEAFGEHLKSAYSDTQETALRNRQSIEELTRHAQKCDALIKALGVQQQQDRESLTQAAADIAKDREKALEAIGIRMDASDATIQGVKDFLEALITERTENLARHLEANESALQIWSALVTELENRGRVQDDRIQEIKAQSQAILADLESLKAKDTVGQDQLVRVQEQVRAIQMQFEAIQADKSHRDQLREASLSPSDYFVFEDRFRGNEADVQRNQSRFLTLFKGCHHVLDIGCGRGEFLDLLIQSGIGASGIDMNPVMVEYCQKRGLRVAQADAFEFLENVEDALLDGVYCGQMIEHLTAEEQIAFVKLVYRKMRFNSYFVIETMNPMNLPTAATHFYTDMSHKRPVTPDGLGFLLSAVGFRKVQFDSLSETPQSEKLTPIALGTKPSPATRKLVEALNQNLDKLNCLLFAYRDFAAMALK
ncbi:MAG TPA: methionine biosynthesis protein MetW [bacterium]|nr:methionine biosynthesis protein MetW [bacterium]